MVDNIKEQATIFSVLSDPTRLRLLKLLCNQHEPDALCVNAMVGLMGISQPAISQHLRVLKSIGLVTGQRRGYHIHYLVNKEAIKRYRELVSEVLNLGEQVEKEPCKGCNVEKRRYGRHITGFNEGA